MSNLKEILENIHDEADHTLGTGAKNKKEVSTLNAKAIKKLAKEALKCISKQVHVVVTIYEGSDQDGNASDVFGDIIGVYDDRKVADNICKRVKKGKPIDGLDYRYLQDYEDAVVLTFNLNKNIINNQED